MTAWGVAQERIAQALDEHLGAAADTEEQAPGRTESRESRVSGSALQDGASACFIRPTNVLLCSVIPHGRMTVTSDEYEHAHT